MIYQRKSKYDTFTEFDFFLLLFTPAWPSESNTGNIHVHCSESNIGNIHVHCSESNTGNMHVHCSESNTGNIHVHCSESNIGNIHVHCSESNIGTNTRPSGYGGTASLHSTSSPLIFHTACTMKNSLLCHLTKLIQHYKLPNVCCSQFNGTCGISV